MIQVKKGFRVSFIDEDNNEQFGIITQKWVKKAKLKLDNGYIAFVPLDELEVVPVICPKIEVDDQLSTIVENPTDDQIPFDEVEVDQDDSDNDHPYIDQNGITHSEIYLNPDSPLHQYYDQIEKLEIIIDQNLSSIVNSFYQIGKALFIIKENNLYGDYDSFIDYCEGRWEFKSAYAYFLINSYLVCDNLIQAGFSRLPTNESQCRVLSTLSNDDQIKVWGIISQGQKITASLIKNEVDKVKKELKAIAPTQTTLFTPAIFKESYQDDQDDDYDIEDDETEDYPNELKTESSLVIDEDDEDDEDDLVCFVTVTFQYDQSTYQLDLAKDQVKLFKKLIKDFDTNLNVDLVSGGVSRSWASVQVETLVRSIRNYKIDKFIQKNK